LRKNRLWQGTQTRRWGKSSRQQSSEANEKKSKRAEKDAQTYLK
jgi:hypothetical protein